ncbi:MAG: 1-phosphofructokinase [Armatimonadetes bacterium]|nr:1-phosphofructokinase [Armatimonadota bacterium]
MILTVTLNSAVDKTYTVENFGIDRVHRPSAWRITAGGKGINVARVYNELGGEAFVTGFVGGHNGEQIIEGLLDERIEHDLVRIRGESRVCVAILDPVHRTQTELNEVGPEVSAEELEQFMAKYEALVQGKEYVVMSGSTPPGVPDGIYAEMIAVAAQYGVRAVLDSSGEPLKKGFAAHPYVAKPNVNELSAIIGRQLATVEETAEVARGLSGGEVEIVIVTLGRDGCLACSGGETLWARPPEIEFLSAVGSGDALAAAFVFVLSQGGSVEEAVRLGTAAGAANATTFGAGYCSREHVLSLAEKVEITRL